MKNGITSGQIERFYKNKKVLITGHSGFKGSWLCLWMEKVGADVVGISLDPPSNPYHYSMLRIKGVMNYRCDVRDYEKLNKIIQDEKPDIVFHMAAQPVLIHSYDIPLETYSINAIGTANVLDSAYRTGTVKAFINVTTDKVYENDGKILAYKETDNLGSHDPYSTSKACSELITKGYRDSFYLPNGIGLSSARAGNTLGGGAWGRGTIVTNLLKSIKGGTDSDYFFSEGKVSIREGAIRPWLYVLDVLRGYLILGYHTYKDPNRYSDAWNFGPNYNTVKTVREFAEKFLSAYGLDHKDYLISLKKKDDKWHEDRILILDSIKARINLGWEPLFDFDRMISEIAKWYESYYANEDMAQYSRKALDRYLELEAESRE